MAHDYSFKLVRFRIRLIIYIHIVARVYWHYTWVGRNIAQIDAYTDIFLHEMRVYVHRSTKSQTPILWYYIHVYARRTAKCIISSGFFKISLNDSLRNILQSVYIQKKMTIYMRICKNVFSSSYNRWKKSSTLADRIPRGRMCKKFLETFSRRCYSLGKYWNERVWTYPWCARLCGEFSMYGV